MCGIAGILGGSTNETTLRAIAESMRHRGPDDHGLYRSGSVALVHTRLIVRDRSDAGAQPFLSEQQDQALVYNGELYNDQELRTELNAKGVQFRSTCDTETVFEALRTWGADALGRFRGMFALAFLDLRSQECLIARDPFGMKPLHVAKLRDQGVVFASEPAGILAHPEYDARPDPAAISAYLTTIRTTLGNRTLFADLETLLPGEVRRYSTDGQELAPREWLPAVRTVANKPTRHVIASSVGAHLVSDVSVCSLLSGGLDSSVIAREVAQGAELSTYCSGAEQGGPDFAFADEVAAHLGVRHTRVPVTPDRFANVWAKLVEAQRVPLSTPNEVAIYEVSRKLRAQGHTVALSGEGADELFAGYETPMQMAWAHVRAGNQDPGPFQARAHAWLGPDLKPGVLQQSLWRDANEDAELNAFYETQYEQARNEPGAEDPLEAHLRLHRRINLNGLLGRLDSATMRASVEGRTPFADIEVASHAAALPMTSKCVFDEAGRAISTKIALRDAFRSDLPASVVDRPKASFPLPFQNWLAGESEQIRSSAFIRTVLTDAAVEAVASNPGELWSLAWPVANLARWASAMDWN